MTDQEFQHDSLEDAQSIARYLNAVVEGLQSGTLDLSDDQGAVQLKPRGLIDLDLRVRRRDNRAEVRVTLSWREGDEKVAGRLNIRPKLDKSPRGA